MLYNHQHTNCKHLVTNLLKVLYILKSQMQHNYLMAAKKHMHHKDIEPSVFKKRCFSDGSQFVAAFKVIFLINDRHCQLFVNLFDDDI